jgi:site-specific DNA recombinase
LGKKQTTNESVFAEGEDRNERGQQMRFFIYARKSTEDDGRQVLSIDSQLDELRDFARKESLQVVREYVEAKTAKEPGRPVFNEMMQAVEGGEAEGLLAWHPDPPFSE